MTMKRGIASDSCTAARLIKPLCYHRFCLTWYLYSIVMHYCVHLCNFMHRYNKPRAKWQFLVFKWVTNRQMLTKITRFRNNHSHLYAVFMVKMKPIRLDNVCPNITFWYGKIWILNFSFTVHSWNMDFLNIYGSWARTKWNVSLMSSTDKQFILNIKHNFTILP